MASVPTTSRHQFIPLAKLSASPLNHRKTFDKVKMDELTESVRSKGILQPILARPLGEAFEVVAGERRFRAAKAAKLVDIPAIVREMNDTEALELQVIENGQRVDPHPLEEAEGYEALLGREDGKGAPYTVEQIAAKVGKSKAYVYGRMKLAALCPEAREAFYAGEIDASRALLIARIGHHDTQRKALKDITHVQWKGEEPMSYREAHGHILQTYMLKLSTAPFDTKDAQLLPKVSACGPCPKRTGNQADLFGDVKSGDVCTDPKCFDDKRQAHYAKAAKELEAKGKKVLYGDAAKKAFPDWDDAENSYRRERLNETYVSMSGHDVVGNRQVAIRDLLGEDYKPLLIQHPLNGRLFEVATRQAIDAARKAFTKGKKAPAAKAPKVSKPKGPDVDEMLTQRLAKLIHEKAAKQPLTQKGWLLELAKEVSAHFSTRNDSLEAVALAWGWKAGEFRGNNYQRRLPPEASKLNERDLVLLMFDLAFAIGPYTRDSVLKLFGIKEQQVREQIIEERKAAAKKAREDAKAAKTKKASPAKKTAKASGMAASHARAEKGKAKRAAKRAAKRGPMADFMKPMQPSAALALIVGDKPLARTEVTSKLWAYIKKNDLQDKVNRRMINSDEKLLPILGKKQVSMFEMTKLMVKHLTRA